MEKSYLLGSRHVEVIAAFQVLGESIFFLKPLWVGH
eukprot:SAG11_NODE_13045_length_672_cov_3.115183_3_plen_35_part_01